MKIKRVVTNINIDSAGGTYFMLNGHRMWFGDGAKMGGIDTIEKIRGAGFRSKFYRILFAILHDKPGVITDLKDPEIIELLTLTECI